MYHFENLQTYYQSKCLLEIYTRSDDSFSVGTIVALDPSGIVIRTLDEQGKELGFYYFRLDFIRSIESDTEYLQKLTCYRRFWTEHMQNNSQLLVDTNFLGGNVNSRNLLAAILQRESADRHIVTLGSKSKGELDTGYLSSLNNGTSDIALIDISTARKMGSVQVKISDIVLLEFESIDNQLLEYANRAIETDGI